MNHKVFTIALSIFIVVLASYTLMQSPFFALQHVVVSGGTYVNEERVMAHGELSYGMNVLQLDPRRIEKRLARLPAVSRVHVARRWPAGLAVDVVEKQPVAYVADGGDFWLVDIDGTKLYTDDTLSRPLPLVTLAEPFGTHSKDWGRSPRLAAALQFARALSPVGRERLSEIHVSESDLVAFTGDHVTIRLGTDGSMDEKAEVLELLLVRIAQGDVPVSLIDVRHPRSPVVERKR